MNVRILRIKTELLYIADIKVEQRTGRLYGRAGAIDNSAWSTADSAHSDIQSCVSLGDVYFMQHHSNTTPIKCFTMEEIPCYKH